ncbi:membrane protein [Streptomyces phage Gilgamesh]|uniref:Membrane protein n=1 Tax=Streptomyces phage Gilgamesh TaxID=2599890 RepID=A0A5J6TTM2_9CAUD|nr:membrane protein [Streptomyces phage Gilgamesh]QFG13219.1 membrane protein [Streptomyces phage Gilgamesh]
MPQWLGKLKPVAYALALLALAHPPIAPPVLGTLAVLGHAALAVVMFALAHLSLTLTVAAGVLLAQTFPGRLGRTARWLGRAWVASVAVVFPRTV